MLALCLVGGLLRLFDFASFLDPFRVVGSLLLFGAFTLLVRAFGFVFRDLARLFRPQRVFSFAGFLEMPRRVFGCLAVFVGALGCCESVALVVFALRLFDGFPKVVGFLGFRGSRLLRLASLLGAFRFLVR